MADKGTIDVGTFTPVWTAGWQWPWALLLALLLGGNFVLAADRVYLGAAILIGGPALVIAGVRAVKRGAADALADAEAQIRRATVASLDIDPDRTPVYTVTAAGGSVVGIDAAKRYDVTVVTVGESALTVHSDVEANLLNTSWTLGADTEEIPYDRIRDVDYVDGVVNVRCTDGDDRSYPADRRPDELLSSIGRRQSSASE
ncbi:hypothetical protein [Halobaculum rubrum]|uniref:hypothetical protein n=1 Tax=Halobaculum rubrum TaxID=2872158 RepID=UPI001CA3E6B6|nr:hypothetical protein [Halobaculum rubrum]QZX99072.1 hypothetical protein K6T25_12535 [Halobaculum rubrum]